MNSAEKFRTMLEMQIEINDLTVPGWREKNLAWRDAIWIECAELMDHIGWKWWKKQEPNLEQAKIEMVDIWHFAMSMYLTTDTIEEIIEYFDSRAHWIVSNPDRTLTNLVRAVSGGASSSEWFDIRAFFQIMAHLGMTLDDLYSRYICKNVLNKFRQDHGYKEGRYLKQWFGEEDNVWLENIIADLDMDDPRFKENLYEQMSKDYEEAKREVWVG